VNIGEAGDNEPGGNSNITAVGGEVSQTIQRGVGLEGATLIRERHKRLRIEGYLELGGEGALQPGVQDYAGSTQRDFTISPFATQAHLAQQERSAIVNSVMLPLH